MDKQKNDEVIELKIDIDSGYTDLCIAGIDYKVNLLWTLEDYMEFSNIDDESDVSYRITCNNGNQRPLINP